jgi:hypothetical protein
LREERLMKIMITQSEGLVPVTVFQIEGRINLSNADGFNEHG